MTNEEMWQAVVNNDKNYDGKFYYAVKTTRIYCRPSCKSKTPLKKNVEFFSNISDAEKAGYRICKRCKSNQPVHEPAYDIVLKTKEIIDEHFNDKLQIDNDIKNLQLSTHRITELFKQMYNTTPTLYMNTVRIEKAMLSLRETDEAVIDIAYDVGYDSLSAFYRHFKIYTAISPTQYRESYNMTRYAFYPFQFGYLKLGYTDDSIVYLKPTDTIDCENTTSELSENAFKQFDEYFQGKRTQFDLPINPIGTEFQQKVWQALCDIPYGETKSYKDIAISVGNEKACRAVGLANNRNQIFIIIPCHRVVGHDGSLTGYGGGLDMKQYLLDIEGGAK